MKNLELDAFDALKKKEKTLDDLQKKIWRLRREWRLLKPKPEMPKEPPIEANREDALKCWCEAQQAEDEAIMRMESVFEQHGALVDRVKKAEENSDTSDSEQEGDKNNPR
ncbi:hypothetical protein CAEBREN_16791 [Caenorhabditis brenneri]|uniref:Uncharacterized protein n=1 Tax=Caenorhabditis brenneri TaxID=135651 RepID=G0NCZ7_CAEBE|nr:hypothetical protein CAEBREN_16791 [Caenorhabditis brenneri]